jgi:hypothetical protein
MSWTDRGVIAALARLLPVGRSQDMLATPSTTLRWHRQLVARRRTTFGLSEAAAGTIRRRRRLARQSLDRPRRVRAHGRGFAQDH